MALTDENSMVMPVAPMYGNSGGFGNCFGGDNSFWLIIFLLFFGFGGWGNGFGGGYGGGFDGGFYPWMNQSNQINNGFRDQMISSQVQGIQSAITSGFGDTALGIAGINQNICQTGNGIQNAINQGFANTNLGLCQGFNGVNSSIFGAQNAIGQQLNANEIANLNRSFAEQTANMQGFNGVNAGISDLRYSGATEACATRTASAQNTRDIIDSQTRSTQAILDKLCQLELDGVKQQVDAKNERIVDLQNQLNQAVFRESQANQNALFAQGMNNEVDALYNRLKNCPVGTTPVYGNQPIFTCGNNGGCGCGCGVA